MQKTTLLFSILFFSVVSAGITVVNQVNSGATNLNIFDGIHGGGDVVPRGESRELFLLHLATFISKLRKLDFKNM